MTDGPGLGGYPELSPPRQRVAQAWRSMWSQGLVHGPKKAKRALRAVQATRATIGMRRG